MRDLADVLPEARVSAEEVAARVASLPPGDPMRRLPADLQRSMVGAMIAWERIEEERAEVEAAQHDRQEQHRRRVAEDPEYAARCRKQADVDAESRRETARHMLYRAGWPKAVMVADHRQVDEHEWGEVLRWIGDPDRALCMVLQGPADVGKTWASFCAAVEWKARRPTATCKWIEFGELVDRLDRFGDDRSDLRRADLLVIDDFGACVVKSGRAQGMLEVTLRARGTDFRPTLVSSNVQKWDRLAERIGGMTVAWMARSLAMVTWRTRRGRSTGAEVWRRDV